MVGGSIRQASPSRTPLVPKRGRRARSRFRVLTAAAGGAILGSALLAACGTSSAETGPVTLNFYLYPDTSGLPRRPSTTASSRATASTRSPGSNCPPLRTASGSNWSGAWPRMTPRSTSWASTSPGSPSSPTAGWIVPWTGANKAAAENGTLPPPWTPRCGTAQLVRGAGQQQHPAAVVPTPPWSKTPPKTWAQMIADAAQLTKEGKPHYIEIQGAQYEGATVWFNTMVASAGGTILNPTATKVTLGAPAVKALSHHEPAGHRPGRGPVAGRADGEPEPAGHGGRPGRVPAELPVRVSGHEAGQPEAVQDTSSGRSTRRSPRGRRPRSRSAARTSRSAATPSTRPWPSRPRCASGTGRTRSSGPTWAASRPPSPPCTATRRCSRTTRSTRTS